MAGDGSVGNIPARGFNWDEVRYPARQVERFATLHYGKSLVEPKRRPGAVPMYGTNGRCGWHDTALANGPGVILGRKGQGHLGVEWCDEPFWVIDTAYYAEVDPAQADLRWFYYITKYVGLDELKLGEKPGLSRDVFYRQLFPFPPLFEQRAIARVLGTLDDKIELNRRMSASLERLARAVFEKWFAENEAFAVTETVQVLTDRGILVVGDGYRAKRSELAESGLPFARAGNLDGAFDFSAAEFLGAAGVTAAKDKVSREYDAVFTSKGTVGRIAQVLPSTPRFVYAPQLCYWRVLDAEALSPDILFQWMKGTEFREQIDSLKCQTDMADYVSLGDQRDMEITLPFSSDARRMSGQLRSLSLRIDANIAQSKTLELLRDALLPRLLSGELRLKDTERTVSEAV